LMWFCSACAKMFAVDSVVLFMVMIPGKKLGR